MWQIEGNLAAFVGEHSEDLGCRVNSLQASVLSGLSWPGPSTFPEGSDPVPTGLPLVMLGEAAWGPLWPPL